MQVLSVRELSKVYGGLTALAGVSFEVSDGTINGVIGPNGAGKTTLFNVLSGFAEPSAGAVEYLGASIAGLRPHTVARLGLVRTFQLVKLFANLSVIENVCAGAHMRTRGGAFAALFRPAWFERQEIEVVARAEALLDLVGLADKRNRKAAELTYGQQRSLEIARALACEPKLLLLDEPAASLTVAETDRLAQAILEINRGGITIMLIEHDIGLVSRVADNVMVLDFGRKIAEGTADQVKADPVVLEAYLGTGHHAHD